MCMCMACVCSHVCYAHCVKMCTHVCKHGCGFSELTLCVFFFITLSIVVKQYVLSNLDFTKSRHSCQQACLGDLSLCCWRAANAGSHPPTHTLPGYIHGSWQSEMWVLVLAQQGLHLLVISTDIFSNTFLLPRPRYYILLFTMSKLFKGISKMLTSSTEAFAIGDFSLWWK